MYLFISYFIIKIVFVRTKYSCCFHLLSNGSILFLQTFVVLIKKSSKSPNNINKSFSISDYSFSYQEQGERFVDEMGSGEDAQFVFAKYDYTAQGNQVSIIDHPHHDHDQRHHVSGAGHAEEREVGADRRQQTLVAGPEQSDADGLRPQQLCQERETIDI